MRGVSIFGLRIHDVDAASALSFVKNCVLEQRICRIYTPNPEIALRARRDREYRDLLNRGELLLPDGFGLVLLSSLSRVVAGSDFSTLLMEFAAREGKKVFLLGAGPGIAEKAGMEWQKQYPGLVFEASGECRADLSDFDEVSGRIRASGAFIVLVALGAPAQERFIDRAAADCSGVGVWIGVGGTFDYVAGAVSRAPLWVRSLHLEWLYRLFSQPLTRIGRIWNAVVVYSFLRLMELVIARFKRI